MIKVTTHWISRVVQGSMFGGSVNIHEVSTDTRKLTPGCLFIALRGPNFDGHEFVSQAVNKGASAVVVDRQLAVNIPQIIVKDTTIALGELAAAIKAQLQPVTVAITGSMGKTTVKEMTAAILAQRGNVLATLGNFNNQIGVPLTLLRLEPQHDYAVIELGANHGGEIAYTTQLTQPDICVVNNIAAAHLEGFGDLDGVAKAKAEIFSCSDPDCIAVVNCDIDYSQDWLGQLSERKVIKYARERCPAVDVWGGDLDLDEQGCGTFTLYYRQPDAIQAIQTIQVQLTVPGVHNVSNAIAAASICLGLGASLAEVSAGLKQVQPVGGRVNLLRVSQRLTVIDDSYNANVDSVKAAVDLLQHHNGHKIMVLGDMDELGVNARHYHQQVGVYAKQQGIHQLVSCGVLSENASQYFEQQGVHFTIHDQLIPHLCQWIDQAQQPVTLLVKGSRSARMELVVQALREHYSVGKQQIREVN